MIGRVANSDENKFRPKKRELVKIHLDCYEIREEGGRQIASMIRKGEGEPWKVYLPKGEGYGIQELRSTMRYISRVAKKG